MNNYALKNALILSAINIAISIVIYILGPGIFSNLWTTFLIMFLSFVLNVVILTIIGKKYRKAHDNIMTFKTGFTILSICCLMNIVTGTAFNSLLTRVIDTEYTKNVKEVVMNSTVSFMENMNTPQEKIDETIEEMQKGFDEEATLGSVLAGFAKSILFYGIVCAIIAAIIKRNTPVFDQTENQG